MNIFVMEYAFLGIYLLISGFHYWKRTSRPSRPSVDAEPKQRVPNLSLNSTSNSVVRFSIPLCLRPVISQVHVLEYNQVTMRSTRCSSQSQYLIESKNIA
jgi:hypothetical protein